MVPLTKICSYLLNYFKTYVCRYRGQVVVKRALGRKSEIREFCPFLVVYTDPLVMFRTLFIQNTYKISQLIICKISPLSCKRKTQTLAYHKTKGIFLTKRPLFSLIVTPTLKGSLCFYLEMKPASI